MKRKARITIIVLLSLIIYVSTNSFLHAINPETFVWSQEDRDEYSWISTSHSWFDRKACRWLGICGASHLHPADVRLGHRQPDLVVDSDGHDFPHWRGIRNSSDTWDDVERSHREIPGYVFKYAPLVHLYSAEQFWPCDIAEHLFHTTPMLNYTPIHPGFGPATLSNLDELNQWQKGWNVFLTSDDNVEHRPRWIEGENNIPQCIPTSGDGVSAGQDDRVEGGVPSDTDDRHAEWLNTYETRPLEDDDWATEELRRRYGGEPIQARSIAGGRSNAPAVLLVMDKGDDIVDAFWFYFYSFNLGNVVLNVRFGNHIGDWEHCLVRFRHGRPHALFFSAHSAGEAYSYEAIEKIGQRPVIYSAAGTHAMYPTPGSHPYILPWGLLHDETDCGPLWDPLLNSYTYTYEYSSDTLRASTTTPSAPTEWFYFSGHWGDKFYPLSDSRQYRLAGQYHYVNGPLGPRFKHLNRKNVCQGPDDSTCVVRDWIKEPKRTRRWEGAGAGEEHFSALVA